MSQLVIYYDSSYCVTLKKLRSERPKHMKLSACMFTGKNPSDEYLEGMMSEAPGPINFTMFLTMFGERLNGTDPEDVIRNAFACFDEEGSGEWVEPAICSGPSEPRASLTCARPSPTPTRCDPRGPSEGAADHHGRPVHR